jgi:integrase
LDCRGQRKYLTSDERKAFVFAALEIEPRKASFCLTLALTGARISEVLALTADRIDVASGSIVIETLKRRQRGMFRAVPVPRELIGLLSAVHSLASSMPDDRLWSFSRPTAWKYVKAAMVKAGVGPRIAKPKALRHAFAVEAVRQRVALSVISKWLGHAKIETTAIYADPVGDEERALAESVWQDLVLPLSGKIPGVADGISSLARHWR